LRANPVAAGNKTHFFAIVKGVDVNLCKLGKSSGFANRKLTVSGESFLRVFVIPCVVIVL
jgi:hypothetical protein